MLLLRFRRLMNLGEEESENKEINRLKKNGKNLIAGEDEDVDAVW